MNTSAPPFMTSHDRRLLRRVTIAATVGNTVETYDYAVYGFLATVLAHLFFPEATPGVALLSTFAIFGAAFVVRPLGSFVFGPLADRIGRRNTLIITLILMAVVTPLIGLLPTAESIGIAAPILLVILRLLQGLAAGGEFSAAVIYAAEFSPHNVRGRMAGRVQFGSIAGFLLAALVVLAVNATLTSEQLSSWGWRLPFLLALPMGLIGLYMRSKLGETPEYSALESREETSETPTRDAFTHFWPLVVLIFLIGSLHMIGIYMVYTYLQTYIISLDYTRTQATFVTVISLIIGLCLIPVGGRITDRWGRWRPLLTICIAVILVSYPLFAALAHAGSIGTVLLFAVLLSVGPVLYSAIVPVTYVEVVPAQVRGTIFAVGYGLVAAILGGTALPLSQFLVNITGNGQAPVFILIASAALSAVAALWVRRVLAAQPPLMAADLATTAKNAAAPS
ncbi:MFS transporter [Rhodococcus ruber]|uniref:MFS transporter n=1 Tax=Rhodococcus ruber TaxID=1830 RepID=UPI00034B4001|nr:MFS transporter [Rhodococcus ruber]